MEIHILGMMKAWEFVPQKPTYAIQIAPGGRTHTKLQESQLYVAIDQYNFDDNDHNFTLGPVWITETMATDILRNFETHKNSIDALMVHCSRGQNRSPAVAMALNEVYGLGQDNDALKKQFRDYNRHTYDTIMTAAQNI